MTPADLPPWPAEPLAYGPVVLRKFSDRDVPMVRELSTDPYVPLIGSLVLSLLLTILLNLFFARR